MVHIESGIVTEGIIWVADELNRVVGTIELSTLSDVARYVCYRGERYVGQAETIEYCLGHYFD